MLLVILCTSILAAPAADLLAVGQPAPPISLPRWLNAPSGPEPSLESLKGKVIMLEFWGTWCGPCVQAMPHVQELHERYQERGLRVLAISYEDPEVMQPFLTQHAYTMTVGSDPTKKVVSAYGVKSWPTTYLIDPQGKIAFAGAPYDVEPAIEKALGLEANPGSLLTAVMGALQSSNKTGLQDTLARVIEKEIADFDLGAWARSAGGATGATPGGAANPPAPEDLLDRCAQATRKKDASARQSALDALASSGTTSFALSAWARKLHDQEFPLTLKEFKDLLAHDRLDAAIDALADRKPGADILGTAVQSKPLKEYSKKKAEEARTNAKKGVMIERWVFKNAQPKDNDAFWKELSVSGVQTSPDKKEILAVLIGGKAVSRQAVDGFIRGQLARAFVMEAIAAGKPPKADAIDATVKSERGQLVKTLESRYGPGGR